MSCYLIIAAEASSAQYGEKIIQEIRNKSPEARLYGIGSKQMEALGFECLGYAEDLAVMGLVEVLRNFRQIKQVFQSVVERVQQEPPVASLLMDYPGFNLRLAAKLKELKVPVVYFIPPQVWVWKKSRIKKIQKDVDQVLTLFPFEQEFFTRHSVVSQFVGHPLIEELEPKWLETKFRSILKEKIGVSSDEKILGVMPGSRLGEIDLNFPTQLQTLLKLHQKYPRLRFLIMVAPTRQKEDLLPYLEGVQFSYMLQQKNPWEMIAACDAVLVVSGTAALQVGLLGIPMVIHYRFRWMTYLLGKFLVRGLRFFGLPNIVLGREVVPERLQSQASPEELAGLVEKALYDPQVRNQMTDGLRALQLGFEGKHPIQTVSHTLMSYQSKSPG